MTSTLEPPRAIVDGAQLFVRYAYPPNERGACGPDDHGALFEYGVTGVTDPGLRQIATRFSGAWPYLELLAAESGIADPLDRRVVEAYWEGNRLLDRVDMGRFGRSLAERFRTRTGRSWGRLEEAIPAGAVPHHGFHVFAVYPWVGLLAADRGPDPLHILDRCRIRWGRVVAVTGDQAVVVSRPLRWDGRRLFLSAPERETAVVGVDGRGFLTDLVSGDWVSLHWDWVCDRLTAGRLAALRAYTLRQLRITNERLGDPADLLA